MTSACWKPASAATSPSGTSKNRRSWFTAWVSIHCTSACSEAWMPEWLQITRGEAPLIVSMPHTGTRIPPEIEARLTSPWLARKDADWHVEKLYDFAPSMGATIIRTTVSRTVIDVNRNPSGVSLYPGQATTELCPTTTFDGEPLYKEQCELDTEEIPARTALYFDPYHAALAAEIARLRTRHS